MNDDSIGGFTVFDFDAAYHFTVWGKNSEIAFNVYNLFDETYFTRSSTTISNTPSRSVTLKNGDTFAQWRGLSLHLSARRPRPM